MSDTETPDPIELEVLNSPRVGDIRFIDTAEELDEAIPLLIAGVGSVAVDAERASGFKYSQRAYLLQIYRREAPLLLIDPIPISAQDPTVFQRLNDSLAETEWIIHAATQDIPCLAELGLRPNKLFDTELAGRLANFERVGLGAIVARCLGFQLAKEHSAVDWSTRPLKPEWLNYAALDVDVLPELRDALATELENQTKLSWAQEEFEQLVSFSPKPQKQDRWRGISGLHSIKDQRQLAIARELWEARERLAQKLDVSPSRLLPDSSILEVVTNRPRSRAELNANKKFAGRASRSYIDLWWTAFEAGVATNDLPSLRIANTGIPNHRSWPSKFPEADARLGRAKTAVSEIAQAIGIPNENLLTPDFLRTVVWEFTEADAETVADRLLALGARKWQIELVSSAISLSLSDSNDQKNLPSSQ